VGISFYTFQTLSYTIDVYRGRISPTRNLLDFALFVAFFPQLVAGPIERASRLLPQLARERPLTARGLASGAWLAGWGLFKKVVIADNLAPLVDEVYAPGANPAAGEVLLATYAFAFQIYCDFSGYTDIARGVARMFGIDLMLNFRLPYLATAPSDFWRRWHISLSTWLRDYLYIPLGGNRGGRARTLRNLMLTMLLGGLWHGAAWTFVCWGAYHGVLLVAERVWRRRGRSARVGAARRALAVAGTFHAVCLGWLFFRADSLAGVGSLLRALGSDPHWGLALSWLPSLGLLLLPLLLGELAMLRGDRAEVPLPVGRLARSGAVAALLLAFLLFADVRGGRPFVYFQF
jgi:D-alanyl-lipoteichoic acid acyltransferase DltB (MBOAT superfamily)